MKIYVTSYMRCLVRDELLYYKKSNGLICLCASIWELKCVYFHISMDDEKVGVTVLMDIRDYSIKKVLNPTLSKTTDSYD